MRVYCFFIKTIIFVSICCMQNSFAMLVKYSYEKDRRALYQSIRSYITTQEQKKIARTMYAWRHIQRMYENPQYENPECVYEGKKILPLVLINKRPIYKKEKPHCLAIDPCKLMRDESSSEDDSDDNMLVLSDTKYCVQIIFNNFVHQIGQENIQYTDGNSRLIKAVLSNNKEDIAQILDKYIKTNFHYKRIKRDLYNAIMIAIHCPYVTKEILERLLWEKKKFNIYRGISFPDIKALNLLASAAHNKDAFTSIAMIDPYNCGNKKFKYETDVEYKTILDRMYEEDYFTEEHIAIMRNFGAKNQDQADAYDWAVNNLTRLYRNQNRLFVRKILSDEKNEVSTYFNFSEDSLINTFFLGSWINPYHESFYVKADEHIFTSLIMMNGLKHYAEVLKQDKNALNNMNNPLIQAIELGEPADIEKEIVKLLNKTDKHEIFYTLNKAIGAVCFAHSFQYRALFFCEQKMFLMKHPDLYNEQYRAKIAYVLTRMNSKSLATLQLIFKIDPYNINDLPWKDDNETEYKTNIERVRDLVSPEIYNNLISECECLTAQEVPLYYEELIGNILKEAPSRNHDYIEQFNNVMHCASWNVVRKERRKMHSVD
ncbi:MAG TPA: hypothetical protein VKU36_03600 [Candidatus Babeliales bacterium]|nr:hypothetical protein [Candidatus Babeliales bacterium]